MEPKIARDIQTIRNLLMFFAGLVLLYLLKVLSHLLIPLFLAMFIAMLLQPIMAFLERKKVPFGIIRLACNWIWPTSFDKFRLFFLKNLY